MPTASDFNNPPVVLGLNRDLHLHALEDDQDVAIGHLITYRALDLPDPPLIVIGYRGAERSVMVDLLLDGAADSDDYAPWVCWCARSRNPVELDPLVRAGRAHLCGGLSASGEAVLL